MLDYDIYDRGLGVLENFGNLALLLMSFGSLGGLRLFICSSLVLLSL
jgi:hypothetical protein